MGSKIQVTAGNVKIGGSAKVSVQSMLNIPSTDIEGSVRQAKELEEAGCSKAYSCPKRGCKRPDCGRYPF